MLPVPADAGSRLSALAVRSVPMAAASVHVAGAAGHGQHAADNQESLEV
jgi:hypothetical protein